MSAITLTSTLVTGQDGRIDQGASEAEFRKVLATYLAERELEEGQIADAVGALFQEHKGARINMPAVVSMTLGKLNAQPENFAVLSDRVAAYVRANSQGKTLEDGSVERPTSTFIVAKGKNGGVFVRADQPAKAEPESK